MREKLLEFDEDLVESDRGAGGGLDGFDDAVALSAEDVLHLHGLDDGEFLTDSDLLTSRDGDGDELTSHGGNERFGEIDLLGLGDVLDELAFAGGEDLDGVLSAEVLDGVAVGVDGEELEGEGGKVVKLGEGLLLRDGVDGEVLVVDVLEGSLDDGGVERPGREVNVEGLARGVRDDVGVAFLFRVENNVELLGLGGSRDVSRSIGDDADREGSPGDRVEASKRARDALMMRSANQVKSDSR